MDETTPKIKASLDAIGSIKRYKNAYQESERTIELGKLLKGVGVVLSSILALLSLLLFQISIVMVINGFLVAVITFAQFFILGTVISNGGHVHKTSIDTAIHTSPFLNNELKSRLLGLAARPKVKIVSEEENRKDPPTIE